MSALRILVAFALVVCVAACAPSEKIAPEVRAAVGDSPVVLLSASWCGYCKRARNDFRAWGVQFREFDVETSEAGRRAYALIGARFVPILLIGDRQIRGYSSAAVRAALADAGELPRNASVDPAALSVSP